MAALPVKPSSPPPSDKLPPTTALGYPSPSARVQLESRRADSNRSPLLHLRVCGQWLLGVAWDCKSRIGKGFCSLSCPQLQAPGARALPPMGRDRIPGTLRLLGRRLLLSHRPSPTARSPAGCSG